MTSSERASSSTSSSTSSSCRWSALIAIVCLLICPSWAGTTGGDDPRGGGLRSQEDPSRGAGASAAASVGGRVTSSTLGLQCPSCDRIHCTPRRANKLRCKGGISSGICNCCPVCAKTEGETCGGQWNYLGKCDAELTCEPDKSNDVNSAFDDAAGDVTSMASPWEGICRKRLAQSDQPLFADRCRPRCTAEYCKAHPKAVCSANDSAERKQSCQAECQHTSCGACTYIRPAMECTKCRRDDFDCIRKFGRCVRKMQCNRTKQKCRGDKDEKRLKFQCLVPSCLVP